MGKTPLRAIAARRLNITDDLKADIRRRYEQTAEPLGGMAADLGCTAQTVCNLAKREGWVRFEPPPRDLSPSARLLARAAKLAAEQSVAAGEPRPERRRSSADAAGEGGRVGVNAEAQVTPTRLATLGDLPLSGGGEEREAHIADTAGQLLHAVQMLMPIVKAQHEKLKRAGAGKSALREAAQLIGNLSGVLRTLHPLLHSQTGSTDDANAYDDMPADLDAFRDALARRIEAFFASRPDAGDGGSSAADGAADAAS